MSKFFLCLFESVFSLSRRMSKYEKKKTFSFSHCLHQQKHEMNTRKSFGFFSLSCLMKNSFHAQIFRCRSMLLAPKHFHIQVKHTHTQTMRRKSFSVMMNCYNSNKRTISKKKKCRPSSLYHQSIIGCEYVSIYIYMKKK